MRDYGKIRTQFWGDEKIQRLSDNAKLLFLYLQTCPHSNGIGCFRLPDGYIQSDLGWVSETVSDTVTELLAERLIERSKKTGWTLILNFLKHNTIDNPNVAKAMMVFVDAVPKNIEFYQSFTDSLKPYAERFPNGYINGLANGMPNREPNLTITKPEPIKKEKQEKEKHVFEELKFFENFWEAFPRQRRGDRDKALAAYRKVLTENKSTEEKIHAAVVRYAGSRDVANGYAAGAAAWLNGAGYDNEPIPAATAQNGKQQSDWIAEGDRLTEKYLAEAAAAQDMAATAESGTIANPEPCVRIAAPVRQEHAGIGGAC